jgi:hypothetical protein
MPGSNGNPAISEGYNMCKRKVLSILNLKGSKYNEAEGPGHYYDLLIRPTNLSSDTYNIRKQYYNGQTGFWLNRTLDDQGNIIWAWDQESCLGSAIWIYKP